MTCRRSNQHLVCQTKRLERANAVSGEVQAGTARRPRCGAFDDVRNDALFLQRPAESKTPMPPPTIRIRKAPAIWFSRTRTITFELRHSS